jgi:porin
MAGNVSGGLKRGATAANQLGQEADVDWEQRAGVAGFSTHVVIVNRSGSSDSTLFGDNVNAVQEIYGGGGDASTLHAANEITGE